MLGKQVCGCVLPFCHLLLHGLLEWPCPPFVDFVNEYTGYAIFFYHFVVPTKLFIIILWPPRTSLSRMNCDFFFVFIQSVKLHSAVQ